MIKQFFKDTAIYGITSFIARGLSLFLLPFYTRVFSPADYGIIDILSVLTNLVNLTVPLEISQGVARYYTDAPTPQSRIAYASTALWFTFASYSIFLILGITFSHNLTTLVLGNIQYKTLLIVALVSMLLSGILYLTQNQLRWQLQSQDYALTNLTFSILSPLSVALLVLVLKKGLISVFYSNIFAYTVTILLSLYFTRQSYRPIFDWAKCKEMLSFSAPLVLSSISVFISLYIDRITIQHLMSLEEVGLYGIGYRFASIATIFLSGFQASLTPLIYNNYHQENTPKEISQIFNIFLTIMLSIIIFFIIFSRELILIFTTAKYYDAYPCIPIITTAIIISNTYIFAPGLGIAKVTGVIAKINILSAITNTILNFVLIPQIGIIGAAVATLIGALLSLILYIKESQKFYFIPYSFKKIALGISPIPTFCTLIFFFNQTSPNISIAILAKISLLVVGLSIVVNSLIGIKNIKILLQQLKRKSTS